MTHFIRRRTFLGGVGALAAGSAYGAAPARGLDAVRDAALINVRLRARSDDGPYFWWMVGTKLGQIEAETKPLFDMHVGSICRIAHGPGGAFAVTSLEVVFYTDLKTGARLKQWANPYTGATVEVSHGPLGPETVGYASDARKTVGPREVGGAIIDARGFETDAVVAGDDAWARTVSTVEVRQKSGAGRPFFVNEWVMYRGRTADILASDRPFTITRAPSRASDRAISSPMPPVDAVTRATLPFRPRSMEAPSERAFYAATSPGADIGPWRPPAAAFRFAKGYRAFP